MLHNLQSQRETSLCNNSRASSCDWLRSHSVTLRPRWYDSACRDAVCRPAPGFSCLTCLWSFSGPTANLALLEYCWRSTQALWLREGCVFVWVRERDEETKTGWGIDCSDDGGYQMTNLHNVYMHTHAHLLFSHWKDARPSDLTSRIHGSIAWECSSVTKKHINILTDSPQCVQCYFYSCSGDVIV